MGKTFRERVSASLSRRGFLQLSAVTAGAIALTGASASEALAQTHNSGSLDTSKEVKRIRSQCRGCGKMECGIWVTVENGRAIKIEGDESSFASAGNSCSKSQASLEACYHPDRLAWPLKRTNPKGEDPGWVRITWDEALETIARKIGEIKEQRGPNSLFSMCGTSRIYCMMTNPLMSLFNSANSHEAYQICKGPRHMATGMQSARTYSWMATGDHPRVFVQWGGASEMSNYDESCRNTVDLATWADAHIVVDPRMTNLGKEADIWLPLRPGTDAAMALGWTNVVIENELYDDLWVKRWTDGPFLVCDDIEPTGWETTCSAGPEPIRTRLLKESDLVEGGSPLRFIVNDAITNKLTYFDAETGLWEGEVRQKLTMTEPRQRNLPPGLSQGQLPNPTQFDPMIDPQLYGTVEVVLKDGRTSTVTPVWQKYVDYLADYTPEKVSEICEVPAEDIVKAATTYATRLDPESGYGNGGIQYMLAIEHSCNAIQTARALDALAAICGNFDTPAGQRGATKGTFSGQFIVKGDALPAVAPELWASKLGTEDIPLLKHYGIWSDSTAIWDACNQDDSSPYNLHGGACWSGDLMNMSNALWAWEGLKKLDFFFVVDLWKTPTAQMADILLPARHWLECDAPRISQGSGGMEGCMCKAVAPYAESWYDVDIVIQLAKAMGIPWTNKGDNPWPDSIFELDKAVEPLGMTWEEFKKEFQEKGFRDCKVEYPEKWGTYRRYETGVMKNKTPLTGLVSKAVTETNGDADGMPGLDTPTCKQEIWSTIIESYHPDGQYNMPTYTEPPEGPVANPEHAKEYPFILTSGRRIPVYFHSEHRQLPWCREVWPVPRIEMNPADAAAIGVDQGDWVWIETERGKIRECVDLYHGIRPGTVNAEHQWWIPEFSSPTKGFDLVNINCLVNKDLRDPLCGSSYVRAYNVKVYKATAENSPFGNPCPCDIDGTPMIASADDPRLKEWDRVYDEREA